jgi:hypothetical protein
MLGEEKKKKRIILCTCDDAREIRSSRLAENTNFSPPRIKTSAQCIYNESSLHDKIFQE